MESRSMVLRRIVSNRVKNSPALLRFCLVGAMNTGVDFSIFALLTFWGFPLILAQTLSYSAGMLNSFLMNRTWTFKQTNHGTGQFIRFLILNLLTLSLTYGLLVGLHGQWQWPLLLSKIVATGLSLGINFVGSRLWVFSSNE